MTARPDAPTSLMTANGETLAEMPCCASLARTIATVAHRGQFRRDGKTAYITHPAAVAARLEGESDLVVAAAWLHDVLEDTEETPETLKAEGVPWEVVDAVEILTKEKGQSHEDYLQWINLNEIARKVKIADMLSNLADAPTEAQIVKYAKGLLFLHNVQAEAPSLSEVDPPAASSSPFPPRPQKRFR